MCLSCFDDQRDLEYDKRIQKSEFSNRLMNGCFNKSAEKNIGLEKLDGQIVKSVSRRASEGYASRGEGMPRGQASLEDLAAVGALLVAIFGFLFLWATTDFTSVSQSTDNLSRFVWAMTHITAPTSKFAIFLEIVLAAVGAVTVARADLRAVLLGAFVIYFGINFVDAWIAAPV